MVAAEDVAKAPKDGSTLLFAASNEVSILPALKKDMAYDARTAFAPVALIGLVPLVLAVHPSVPADNVLQLVALAKKEPGQLNYASFGVGTSNHLAAELFKSVTGTNIVHVPYKGGSAALPDLLSGRVEMCFHAIRRAPLYSLGCAETARIYRRSRSPCSLTCPRCRKLGCRDSLSALGSVSSHPPVRRTA